MKILGKYIATRLLFSLFLCMFQASKFYEISSKLIIENSLICLPRLSGIWNIGSVFPCSRSPPCHATHGRGRFRWREGAEFGAMNYKSLHPPNNISHIKSWDIEMCWIDGAKTRTMNGEFFIAPFWRVIQVRFFSKYNSVSFLVMVISLFANSSKSFNILRFSKLTTYRRW